MIVKMWNIKAGGNAKENLKRSIDYIQDKNKTTDKNLKENLNYIKDENKTNIQNSLEYVDDDLKTKGTYVSGVDCSDDMDIAMEEFFNIRKRDLQAVGKDTKFDPNEVIAVHLVQSFREGEVDPYTAHQCGIDLINKIGGFKAVIATHAEGTDNIHNHIILNAYATDPMEKYGTVNKMKFYNNRETLEQLKNYNDEIALERGLSIEWGRSQLSKQIADENGIEYSDKKQNQSMYENRINNSFKQKLRDTIDDVKLNTNSYNDFIDEMKKRGYTIRDTNKTISFIDDNDPNMKKPIRGKRLGDEYSKSSLTEYFELNEKQKQKLIDDKYYTRDDVKIPRDGKTQNELEIESAVIIVARSKSQNWKIDNFMNALDVMKNEKLYSKNDIKNRLNEFGKKYAGFNAETKRLNNAIEKYKKMDNALSVYNNDPTDINRKMLIALDVKKIDDEKYYKNKINELQQRLDMINDERNILNQRFKNVSFLDEQLQYANSADYLYGEKYDIVEWHIDYTPTLDELYYNDYFEYVKIMDTLPEPDIGKIIDMAPDLPNYENVKFDDVYVDDNLNIIDITNYDKSILDNFEKMSYDEYTDLINNVPEFEIENVPEHIIEFEQIGEPEIFIQFDEPVILPTDDDMNDYLKNYYDEISYNENEIVRDKNRDEKHIEQLNGKPLIVER